jgi:hypothetical protein
MRGAFFQEPSLSFTSHRNLTYVVHTLIQHSALQEFISFETYLMQLNFDVGAVMFLSALAIRYNANLGH